MKLEDLQAIRASACDIIATLGAILDEVKTAEETIRNPQNGETGARLDAAVISGRIDDAAAHIAILNDDVQTFQVQLTQLCVLAQSEKHAAAEPKKKGAARP